MAAALLACDWGTTNLRAWTLDAGGAILARRDFELGVSRLAPGEAPRRFAEEVRPALGAEHLPAILCGMVGSTLGWTVAPYADCPTDLNDLAARVVPAPGDSLAHIIPGVRSQGFGGQGDVMRGEETQVFGWLATHPKRAKGRVIVCQPGTHAKWMLLEDGKLTAFVTAMTGELYDVLTRYSVLRTEVPPDDPAAFDLGVAAAGDGAGLSARLFTARARVVGLGAAPAETSSYLSGLLIGADVAGTPGLLGIGRKEEVVLLGEAKLCGHYRRALELQGRSATIYDGEAAVVAGLFALSGLGGRP